MKRTFRAALFLAMLSLAPTVHAVVYSVTSTSDTHALNPGTGPADSSGFVSLRSAIEAANYRASSSGSAHQINLPAGTYNLSLGELRVGNATNLATMIHGLGTPANTLVQQTTEARIFNLNPSNVNNVICALDNLTVSGGVAGALGGGGILCGGLNNFVTLTNCVISNNRTHNTAGGGLACGNGGSLTVVGCVFSNNTATNNTGGGIDFEPQSRAGNLIIQNSSFSGNLALQTSVTVQGGAIFLNGTAGNTYAITQTAFVGNSASGAASSGGAIYLANGSLTANECRIVGNTASLGSGIDRADLAVGTVDAQANWWGVNAGPGSAAHGFTPTLWLELRVVPAASSINLNATTAFTADIRAVNNGGTMSQSYLTNLPAFPPAPTAIFSGAQLGTLSGAVGQMIGGGFTASFTSGAACGLGQVVVTADSQSVTGLVSIIGPPPVSICSNIVMALTPGFPGVATVSGANIDGGSTAACGISLREISKDGVNFFNAIQFTCDELGTHTATLRVTDTGGQTALCTATVTVVDATPPLALCKNIMVPLDATGHASIVGSDVDNGSAANCGGVTHVVHPNAFNCANLGFNPVMLTVTDAMGRTNQCTAIVTIVDPIPPIMICPELVATNAPPGSNSVVLTYTVAATDNCGAVLNCVPASGTAFPLGSTLVNCTSTDPAGNSSFCSFLATVCPAATVLNTNDSGPGSLRQVILDACPSGLVVFDSALSGQTIALSSGELVVDKNLTIAGLGANKLTVSGAGLSRVFSISAGISCTLTGLTIANGNGMGSVNAGSGGGILNLGELTLANCALVSNSCGFGFGGGAYSAGLFHLSACTVGPANTAGYIGGGIYCASGTELDMSECTVSGNSTFGYVGGVAVDSGGPSALTNCTITANWDASYSGGYGGAEPVIVNTIIAGNTSSFISYQDIQTIEGSVLSLGHNLIGIADGVSGWADSDLTGNSDLALDARLGPLTDNGGPTLTHALLGNPDSPAIDAGDNANAPLFDQRGPGFPRVVNGLIDIGAVERQSRPLIRGMTRLRDGSFWFSFMSDPGASFTVVASTNVALSTSNWTALGLAIEAPPGQFQFTDHGATNYARRFYQLWKP